MRELHLNENTSIPLFPVLSGGFFLIGAIVGAILWMTSVDSKASAAVEKAGNLERAFIEMSHNVREIRDNVLDVRERVIRIEQRQADGGR